jgi:hypothetical protein
MLEAKALGLEISAGMAANAERFNDNMSRMGAAMSGLVMGITAALAPALAAASDAMVEFVKWVVGALQYLPQLTEYVAVAGGAFALAFSPAIVAAVGALATAIGTALVGAVSALTAVMMANPLLLFATAVATAVTAAYYFRDEIQKAIGIDVVQIARDTVNTIVGTFVGAFDAIRATWSSLPAAFGDLAYQIADRFQAGITAMVRNTIASLNGLIATINGSLSSIGVNIPQLGGGKFGLNDDGTQFHLQNPYAGAAAGVGGKVKSDFADAYATDYVGELGKAFSGATPAAQNFAGALSGVNDELDDMSGGKGKKGNSGKLKQARDGIDKVAKAMEGAKQSLGQGFGNIIEGLVNKTLTWKDAIMQVGQALLKYVNAMNVAQGGKGLFGGGLLQGLFGSLLGFASGGSILPGGAGGIDSQVVAFRKSPSERVDIYDPGKTAGEGRGVYAPVYNIDARGADQAAIARLERGLAERDKNFGRMVDHRIDVRQSRKTRP